MLQYLLTYKFSQDHLELFFCAIRAHGCFNNNPTAQQFTAAYKRLLLHSGIKGLNGNCQAQDNTDILDIVERIKFNQETVNLSNISIVRKYELVARVPLLSDHDYAGV